MAVETELKLSIEAGHLRRLRRHPLLRARTVGRARTVHIYSVYYDTPALQLHRHAMALRLRRYGNLWVQTLKGGGQASAGLHQRNEWEMPVAAEQLDFAALAESGAVLPHGAHKQLQPLFVTDFSRTVRLIDFEGTRIELCMDSGEIRAGKATHPVSELELELKSGEPLQLFRLALELLEIAPLRVEHTSKAEYGYRLFAPAMPHPVKAGFSLWHKAQSASGALQALIGACLAHVQDNVPGALQRADEEYLHQLRVGLRRLRVVLAIARYFRDDAETSALRREVAGLGAALGQAREWDVLATQTLPAIRARHPQENGWDGLLRQCARKRASAMNKAGENLASTDFQRMLLRFGAWLYGAGWPESSISLERLARRKLQKLHARVHELALDGDEDPARLHSLRIACKKLRYSAEIFGPLMSQGGKAYLAKLAAVQDALGALHDIAIADQLLRQLDGCQWRATLALVHAALKDDRAHRVAVFNKAWRRFAQQDGFWN